MPNTTHTHGIHELLRALFRHKNWNETVERRFQSFYNSKCGPKKSFDSAALFGNLPHQKYMAEPRNKDIFYRFWGICTEPETLKSIGLDYKISAERVRQIKNKALRIHLHPSRSDIIRSNLEKMGFFF
jgi:hypothetical protein